MDCGTGRFLVVVVVVVVVVDTYRPKVLRVGDFFKFFFFGGGGFQMHTYTEGQINRRADRPKMHSQRHL